MTRNHTARSVVLAGSSMAALSLALTATVSAPAMAQEASDDTVIVTGSRIARRDFQANSPIVTVERDSFENRSSFNVEAALNQLPQFTPSGSSFLASSAGTPFPDAAAAPGAATLDLRGLGANRSLTLVNGRRPQPVNSQLVVDVNSIPSAAVQNVEVITGGAAAVYGADAIAGVVNFILRDDFEGLEVDAQYGISQEGDGEESQVSVLLGGNFDNGRGNAMIGAVWSQRDAAFQRNRDFYTDGWQDPDTQAGSLSNAVPGLTQVSVNGVQYGVNFDGSLFRVSDAAGATSDPFAGPYTGPTNQLEGGAGFKINPDGSLGYNDPDNQLTIPSTRYSIFASGHYDITENVTAYLEMNYTENQTTAQSLVPPAFNIWTLSMPYDQANDDPDSPTFGANPSTQHPVSAELADLLNSRASPTDPWTMTRSLDFLGRLRTETTSEIYQITAGLQGDVGIKDWTWDVYGSHGRTSVLAFQPSGGVSQENLQQIFDGVATAGFPNASGPWSEGWTNGEVLAVVGSCESGIPIFNDDGSVPDQVTVSQDCVDYATLELNSLTQLEQNIVEATVQGGLFDIWAGEVRFAAGATYRDADFLFNPDSGYSSQQQRANVINLIALPQQTSGYISVGEVYGELLIPLISDVPMIQQLDLELGGRYSDYNTAGGIETYKILGDWQVTDWLRFRGGYQRANRAPNIYELFAPVGATFSGSNDPCSNIPGFTADYGNLESNPNRVNVQIACEALISRDGGFDYTTLAEDPSNTGEDPANYPAVDQTHLSNFRWTVPGYNIPFPFNIALEQGNPNLGSEVADTFTFGGVLRSPVNSGLLSGAALSVDWYSIELEGTIAIPGAMLVYQQCLDPEFNPLIADAPGSHSGAELLAGNQYCDLINREPVDQTGTFGGVGSGIDRNYDARYVNQGGTKTSGIDVQLDWASQFADMGINGIPGGLSLSLLANILLEFEESPFPGAPFVDYKGTLQNQAYDYKLYGTLNYNVSDFSIGLRSRYLPSIDPAPGSTAGTLATDEHIEFDLFGRWQVTEGFEVRGGIDNVLDASPEIVGATPADANLGSTIQTYDTLGRRFYVGATSRF